MLTLADVLEALTGTRPQAASLIISEAAIDSRQVIPAAMFVALPGERVDGHAFIKDAFQQGAHIALIQQDLTNEFPVLDLRQCCWDPRFVIPEPPFCIWVPSSLEALQTIARFWRAKHNIRVIGITGSVGKSTTKELVADVLSQRYNTLKNLGNLNNEIGLPLTLLRLGPGYQRAVLEMGFYVPGEIRFLCHIARPKVGVITNVGTVHAERAGSQEMIARGKRELVESLPEDGTAILNYDDPLVRQMANHTSARVLFYGLTPEADLWADEITSQGLKGISFRLHTGKDTLHVHVPMIGQHSVHTVLRAAAVGLVEGLTWEEILLGLQQSRAQLRLVAVQSASGALILDDTYNASPESTMAALNLLGEMDGRRIAVLGDMLELGPYEQKGHELVGGRAAEIAQVLVAVGSRGKMIADAARQAGMPSIMVVWVENNSQAIASLSNIIRSGDVVLVKGSRSMHMEEIVAAMEVME